MKFKITKVEYFEIEVEARDEGEAYDMAHNQDNDDNWQNINSETISTERIHE